MAMKRWLKSILVFTLCVSSLVRAQRAYAPHSVLASGNWYKLAVREAGVYKIDAAFLSSLGITQNQIPTNSIRLFGNGGAMLLEACGTPVADDLQEIAMQASDNGDGIFNGTD